MASMSYCIIENTSGDMAGCVEKMNTRASDIMSNEYEKRCLSGLYASCKEFVRLYEEYQQDKENFVKQHTEKSWWEEDDDED